MDRQQGTGLEGILEQLIEHGADDMANVFARMFELAMRIERERFLGAGHYERAASMKRLLRSSTTRMGRVRLCSGVQGAAVRGFPAQADFKNRSPAQIHRAGSVLHFTPEFAPQLVGLQI